MRKIQIFLFVVLFPCLLGGCEKPILTTDDSSEEFSHANLTLSIFQLEQTPFSSFSRATVSEVCSRLNFSIYNMEDTRIKQINQKVGDSDFGIASFELPKGSYQLVVLAHSSNGNPTMTNPQKIQFTNALGYSDTFLYYDVITIGDESQTISLSLSRIVSLCRFVIEDAIPQGIARLEFTYKGGSGHFNAKTSLGVTKSTQVVKFDVQAGQRQTQYDLYTFLHNIEDTVQLTVIAYDSADNPLYEREFDVPMEQNKITWLTGEFFIDVSPSAPQTFNTTITIDDDWSNEEYIAY